jgi:AAA family ATP:ADP antiporter
VDQRRTRVEVAVLGAVAFAALLASYSAFRPVRDALILDGDLDQIPWLFLATFLAVSVVSPMWSALLARSSRPRAVPLAFHAFAICEVGFFLVVRARIAPVSVGHVFYVWSAVFNLFVVSVFWSLLADLLGPDAARRLYGPIAAGGTVGTFVGPLLTRLLVGTIGAAGVLLMSALLLELAALCVHRLRRAAAGQGQGAGPSRGAEAEAPAGGGAFTGVAHVARSRYLSTIAGYVLCTSCAATFLYLQQAGIVKAAIPDRAARTEYFASIDLWVSAVALILQTLIARPALGRLGPGLVLVVLPLVQLAGISVISAAPSLAVLAVIQVIGRATTHGLTRPARELLFTVVSRDEKYRAKNAIDTIAYRFGDVGSSWLYKGLLATSGGSGALIGTAIVLAVGWIGFASFAGAGFRRRVTKEPS